VCWCANGMIAKSRERCERQPNQVCQTYPWNARKQLLHFRDNGSVAAVFQPLRCKSKLHLAYSEGGCGCGQWCQRGMHATVSRAAGCNLATETHTAECTLYNNLKVTNSDDNEPRVACNSATSHHATCAAPQVNISCAVPFMVGPGCPDAAHTPFQFGSGGTTK
jgi:hypothetical protein